MSAPKTDLDTQEERHKGPLIGMGAAVLWAAVLVIGLLVFLFMRGDSPEGAETQVNGITGEQVEGE